MLLLLSDHSALRCRCSRQSRLKGGPQTGVCQRTTRFLNIHTPGPTSASTRPINGIKWLGSNHRYPRWQTKQDTRTRVAVSSYHRRIGALCPYGFRSFIFKNDKRASNFAVKVEPLEPSAVFEWSKSQNEKDEARRRGRNGRDDGAFPVSPLLSLFLPSSPPP